MEEEVWKTIPGYEGLYEASDQGRVRSVSRKNTFAYRGGTRTRQLQSVILKPGRNTEGRHQLNLHKGGKKSRCFMVSQLVAMAFLGHKPGGITIVVDHIDNDPTNNRLENLQCISHRKNTVKDKNAAKGKRTGVCHIKDRWRSKPYRAYARVRGVRKFIGSYATEDEAGDAYDAFVAALDD